MRNVYLSLMGILFFAGTFFTNTLQAQRNCGATEYLEMQMEQDPKRAIKMDQIERQTRQFLRNSNSRAVNGTITIPVVVHVVYNNGTENISDAQIQSQMDVINADFRRTNSDADNVWSQAADSEIEFCLATVDPSGNPTNGITRTSTTRTSFSTNDDMKFDSRGGKDAWPRDDYLNMWVCDISGGILGYAQFPGGAASTDGVVMDYQYFGTIGTATAPFDLGRTTTHEIGHWLNLRHIWGDGGCGVDDFVGDTPTSDAPNYGCTLGHVSCGSTDMVQNYMDYSDDACMNLYTTGQKDRMRALFDTGGFRESLLSSGGCGTPATPTCNDGIQNGNETGVDCGGSDCPACPPQTCTDVVVSILTDNYPGETTWQITNAGGAVVASGGPYGSTGTLFTSNECLDDGCYDFTIFDSYGDGICCAYGNGSYSVTVDGQTVASGGAFASSETTNFCIGGSSGPTCDDGIQNGDETGVDCGGSSCPACPPPPPTCDDGIQNGNETGVDCGGPDCDPCNTGCSTVQVDSENFDSGWGIWNDGGSDCRRSSRDAQYANSGNFCVRLRDNTSTSVMTTDQLNLAGFEEVTIDFTYLGVSMETGEDFWLQASVDGGAYQTLSTWASGSEFSNNVREFESVVITGAFTSNIRFRFRCDASANGDRVYIDDVNISGCSNGARMSNEELLAGVEEVKAPSLAQVLLFPNPTSDLLNVDFDFNQQIDGQVQVLVTDITGKTVQNLQWNATAGKQRQTIDVSQMAAGIYMLHLINGDERVTQKFVVNK
ncbi:MAG: M43 family zinc metalloprotease [Bacteroidota bacterium]